jgi:hypothetical protein
LYWLTRNALAANVSKLKPQRESGRDAVNVVATRVSTSVDAADELLHTRQ